MAVSRAAALLCLALVAALCAGCHETPARPTPAEPCAWSLSTTSSSFPAAGGEGAITVTTGSGCPWSARSDAVWVTITVGAAASGSAVIQFSVASNLDTSGRRGSVTVSDQMIAVNQEGRAPNPCEYSVMPEMREFPSDGGTGAIAVSAASHCTWTASSSDAWISIVSDANGSGEGTVAFSVAANGGTSERTATLTIAGRAVSIRQLPPAPPSVCTYAVLPTTVSLDFRGTMPYTPAVTITTAPGCTWTASSEVSWIRLATTQGSGAGTLPFTVDTYTGEAARSAPIMARWPTITAGQNVWVTQTGCHFFLASTQATFPVSGGLHRVDVLNGDGICPSGCGCPWTATSAVSWVRITSSLPRYGDDALSFAVDPNPGAQRSGVLTIAGKSFLVIQAGT